MDFVFVVIDWRYPQCGDLPKVVKVFKHRRDAEAQITDLCRDFRDPTSYAKDHYSIEQVEFVSSTS